MSSPANILSRIRDTTYAAGQWCAVASLFVVTLNKPATNVAIVLAFVFSLLGSGTHQRWLHAAKNPVAQGALVWWFVLMLSALHTWYLTSWLPLKGTFVWVCLYPLIFGSLLQTPEWRRRALLAFAAGTGLVLLISCGMDWGLFSQRSGILMSSAMRNTVFKEYTQQGLAELILGSMAMAVAAFTDSRRIKIICLLIVVLVLANVMYMLESRTAYLVLIPLALYWAWIFSVKARLTRPALLASAGLAVAILAVACSTSTIWNRLVVAVPHETELYLDYQQPTSTGIRLELWRRTLPIIAAAPVFGHGLHQWRPIYRQSIEGMANFKKFDMGHPHQEMLLIASEQGLAGLAVFLFLLLALARYLRRLDRPERDIFMCILLIYLTAGLANCLWSDFTHRHVFILLLACVPFAQRGGTQQAINET